MENLTVEELQSLLSYYIKRASDLELSALQNQLKLNESTSKSLSLESKIFRIENELNFLKSQQLKEKEEIAKKAIKASKKKS